MENSSVYMCFPCYQEFNTLDEVLQHQLTCTAEATEPAVAAPGMTTINAPLRQTQVFQQMIAAPAESVVAAAIQTQAAEASKKAAPGRQHAAAAGAAALSDQPRILYQCGDCDELFKSLDQWQQHRKEGACLKCDGKSKPAQTVTEVEVEVDPDTAECQSEAEAEMNALVEVKVEPGAVAPPPGPDMSEPSAQAGPDETGPSDLPGPAETESSEHPGPDVTGSSAQPDAADDTVSSAQVGSDESGFSAQTPEEAHETKQQSSKEEASAESASSAQNSEPPDGNQEEEAEEEETSTYRRRTLVKKAKPDPVLLCVDCGSSFSIVSELVAHRKGQHGLEEALHRCLVCGESFLNTTLFLYHRKQHQGVPSESKVVVGEIIIEPSEEEGEGHTQSNGLEDNDTAASSSVPIFTQEESFLCTHCGEDIGAERSLAAHRRDKHGLDQVLHRCDQCEQEFMNTTRYLYHRRTHRTTTTTTTAEALTDLQSSPRKRLLSPTSSLCDSSSPVPKRGRPPLHSGNSPVKEELRDPEADADSTNLPPPAKLLQDWARTSLPHVCPHCGKTFTRRVFLRAHVFSHTGEKLFTCKVCKKSFSNSQSLLRHTMNHTNHKPYSCDQCGKNFTQAPNLRRHQLTHTPGNPPRKRGRKPRVYTLDSDGSTQLFPCTHCPSRFNTEEQLNHHKLLHTTHPFPCPECGVAFKRRKELDLHSLAHQDKEPATCEHCGSQFINQSVLEIHLQRCPTNEQDRNLGRGRGQGRGRCTGQVECDLCGHRCMTQEGLDLHRLSHTGQTPLKCPVTPCRRRFASSQALEEHMMAHLQGNVARSKGRPRFSCDICLKEFAYTSTFNVHMRTHTDERPFECAVCNKRFRQLPHLQDHERIHSGVRPFSCWVCGKSFSVAARLTEHARTHSGEKPYPCMHCAAAFRSRSNLDKHVRLHGVDVPPAREQSADEAMQAAQVAQVQRVLEGAKVLTSLATTSEVMEVGGATMQTIYVLQTGEGGGETVMIPSDQLGMLEGTNQVVILPSSMLSGEAGQTITMHAPCITMGGQEITMVQQSEADEHGAIEFIMEETV